MTVPNGPSDTATFALSNTTGVSLSADTEVNGIVFNAGANSFTITPIPLLMLTLSGAGITNSSGIPQNFVSDRADGTNGQIVFTNSATAGNLTVFTNGGSTTTHPEGRIQFFNTSTAGNGNFINNGSADSGGGGGGIDFFDSSTAGDGNFTNNGGTVNDSGGGFILFSDTSTAGNGTFTNNPGAVGANGGGIQFNQSTTAGNGTFVNNGGAVSGARGGSIAFVNQSTAAQATLIANGGSNGGEGGSIQFNSGSDGGTARMEIFGNGNLDISARNRPPVSVGSIEGNGNIFLGSHRLIVGTNNLDTVFSGTIQDGGIIGGAPGKLTKVGTGTLVLRNSNAYTGGTTINGGKLVVDNESGSGTGSGPVQVNAGRLGGSGMIAGEVTVGDGSGRGAILSPGESARKRGTLTIQSTLTFKSDAIYKFNLNSDTAKSDSVVPNGVTINSGAQFTFTDVAHGTLPIGTVFTVINNMAATLIAGTFSNLPDGSTFTANGNTYQVNYEGGDGNNLTLRVVP